jgi:hypothetical protein
MTGGGGDHPAATTPEPEHDTFAFAPSGSSRSLDAESLARELERAGVE